MSTELLPAREVFIQVIQLLCTAYDGRILALEPVLAPKEKDFSTPSETGPILNYGTLCVISVNEREFVLALGLANPSQVDVSRRDFDCVIMPLIVNGQYRDDDDLVRMTRATLETSYSGGCPCICSIRSVIQAYGTGNFAEAFRSGFKPSLLIRFTDCKDGYVTYHQDTAQMIRDIIYKILCDFTLSK